ncbi:MAG: pilus assembly protein PilM [Candidatus Omnitrophota bacterium]|nr:pilus assembly protein PilM [Candidatus Omnitrophota bacterium]
MLNKLITALEITSTHIKLAQSQPNSQGRIIKKLMVETLTSSSPDDITKSLREMLSSLKIKASSIILALPRQLLTLRTVRLPSSNNQEIEKMVELQISKQIPYPREEIVADYLIVDRDTLGYSQVLLVICQKEVINRYLKITSSLNLKVNLFTLSSQGVCNWYQNFMYRKNFQEIKPVVLLDIDAQNTDICFYHKENVLFTRSISFGKADIKLEKLEILIEELRKTFSTLQKEQIISQISKIVITTSAQESKSLMDKLRLEFPYEVEAINPLTEVELEKELIVPLALSQSACSSTSILGLVLLETKNKINLLPAELKKEQEHKSKIKELISLAILLFLSLILSAGILATKIYKKDTYIKKLDSNLKEISPKAKKTEATIKKLSLVKERLNPRGSSIDVIYELYNLIPEGLSLSIFSFEENEFITLQGISLAMSDVFNFQSILEKSPYFKNVEVKYASKRKIKQTEITDFRISCAVDKENIKKP